MASGKKAGSPRQALLRAMEAAADEVRAANLAWFFKTGKGEYGYGDVFLGLRVPVARKIALAHRDLSLEDISKLLKSRIHEHRFAALEILVAQFEKAGRRGRDEIFRFYLANTAGINNWDLVDTSAPYIVGEYVATRSRAILDKLARSEIVWERRIAMVATLGLMRHGITADTYRIARRLLNDPHDLIQKASGWMLREAGKLSRDELINFLERYGTRMPRTTLRYAIERFPTEERRRWLTVTSRKPQPR